MQYNQQNDNELYHYGVLGMRWGVRRASKKLSRATDNDSRSKAMKTLNKHKDKGTAKLAKLEKQGVKLEDSLRKSTSKDRTYAAKLEQKAAKIDRKAAKKMTKAGSMWTSDDKRIALMAQSNAYKYKADALHAKASSLNAKYEQTKARVDSNKMMQEAFRTELKKIDNILVENGRRYMG